MFLLGLDSCIQVPVHRVLALTRQLGDKLIHRTAHQGIDDP